MRASHGVLVLTTLLGATSLHAVQIRDITPPEGVVRFVAAHPVDRGRLLVLTNDGSRTSADGGRTWSSINVAGPKVPDRVFVHPGAPGTVFVQMPLVSYTSDPLYPAPPLATQGGQLFRSRDFGATWTQLRPGYEVDPQASISPFGSRPGNPLHLYATLRSGRGCVTHGCFTEYRNVDYAVVESLDGGDTWSPAGGGLPEAHGAFSFSAPNNIPKLYGATAPTPAARKQLILAHPEGVFISDDAARSWRRVTIRALADAEWVRPDPLRGHIYYALLRGDNILRSDDGGETWKHLIQVGRHYPRDVVPDLVIDPVNSDRLWISGAELGLLLSEDRGETWSNLGFAARLSYDGTLTLHAEFNSFPTSLAVSPADPFTAYVLRNHRLFEVKVESDGTRPVAEFLDLANNRYWLTANAGEALAVDYAHETSMARRTGAGFRVWSATQSPEMQPVCRFQGNPARGLHSRFFTLDGPECAALAGGSNWRLEAREDFRAFAPLAGGACADGLWPLRRFFNGLADANHRFVVDTAVGQQMRARGWAEEGTAMCVAAP